MKESERTNDPQGDYGVPLLYRRGPKSYPKRKLTLSGEEDLTYKKRPDHM
jgi:hypothetical protein